MKSKLTTSTLPIASEQPPKFAILQTDSVVAEYQSRHGDYPDMFVRLLGEAGIAAAQVDAFDVQRESYPDPAVYTGYLITGSKSSVYDDEPWIPQLAAFVDAAMAAGRKVVGICFGHQLLAHYFGGHVEASSKGWAVGVHQNTVLTQLPWMLPPTNNLSMVSSHKDQVLALPADATLIVSTEHCPIAGFVVGDLALALQGHPEYSTAYAADLMSLREHTLGPTLFADGLASLDCPLDTNVVGQWIANFLLGETLAASGSGAANEAADAE